MALNRSVLRDDKSAICVSLFTLNSPPSPFHFFTLSDRLEAELEKLQNSSRSGDTTLFSTPCWNTTSPWDNNGTFLLSYGSYVLCLFILLGSFSYLIVSTQYSVESQIKKSTGPKVCLNSLSCCPFQPPSSLGTDGFFCLILSVNQLCSSLLSFLFSFSDWFLVPKPIHMLCFRPAGSKKEERSGQRDEGKTQGFNSRVSTIMFLFLLVFNTSVGFS